MSKTHKPGALDLKLAPDAKPLRKLVRDARVEARCACGSVLPSNALLAWRSGEIDRLMSFGAGLLGVTAEKFAKKWPFNDATTEDALSSLHFAQKQLWSGWVLSRELGRDLRRTRWHQQRCHKARLLFAKGTTTILPDLEQWYEEPIHKRVAAAGEVEEVCPRCDTAFVSLRLMVWRAETVEGTLNIDGDSLNDDGNFPSDTDERIETLESVQTDLYYQCRIARELRREFARRARHGGRCVTKSRERGPRPRRASR
jgi:hypothetical protein